MATKILLYALGIALLLLATVYPILFILAVGTFYFAYKYKAKNQKAETVKHRYPDGEIRKYVKPLTDKGFASYKDETGSNFKITAKIVGAPSRTFTTQVAGVTYDNPDGTNRQKLIAESSSGQSVNLAREKDNQWDKWAVAVHDKKNRMLGYIPAGDVKLASHMDRGGEVKATIDKITGGRRDKKTYGLVLKIEKKDFDWKNIWPYMDKDKQIKILIEEARNIEKDNPQKAIEMYRESIKEIIEFDNISDISRAWRNSRIPIDRLTLLLERAGKLHEAHEYIQWYNNFDDYVGLTSDASKMLIKREGRLKARISRSPESNKQEG